MSTTEPRRRWWNAPWLGMALVIIVFCGPLFVALDGRDFENDESIYAFGVDVMLKSGDWPTPRAIPSETDAFLEKPPLQFWIVGLPIRWDLLPDDEFGMRFWDALMGSVAFLYIFAIGRRIAGPICGVTAVLILFAHGPLILQHGLRTHTMESAVFLAYAAGVFHLLAWRSSGPDARGHVFAMSLAFVLAFMTKFVAACFLPAVLGIAVLLTAGDRARLRWQWPRFAAAALFALVLIAPWFVYEYLTHGQRLIDVMFLDHVVKRFTPYVDPAHLHPWHYYVTELWRQLHTTGADVLVGVGAALLVVRVIRARWLEGAVIVLWFALPVMLISTGTSKLYHYLYPFLPPVAIAGGYGAAKLVGWTRRLLGAFAWSQSAPGTAVRAAAALAVWLALVPLQAYATTLSDIRRVDHPLRDVRTCLSAVVDRAVAGGQLAPGVWVEARGFSQAYAYYLHQLGPWQVRADMPSNATVAKHLFAPGEYRPVLLDKQRYAEFLDQLSHNRSDLLARAAAKANVDPDVLLGSFGAAEVSIMPLEAATLLLPGPFSACASTRLPAVSR